jgi:hypothetical protein
LDSKENCQLMNTFLGEENCQLMSAFLGKECQRPVALGVPGDNHDAIGLAHGLDGPMERFSKPLHRHTDEAGPSKSSNLNVLKRKERDSLGVLGEICMRETNWQWRTKNPKWKKKFRTFRSPCVL